jgi:hypothetical protein
VQFWQEAPLWPQTPSAKPGWQIPLLSQQPAQFDALHMGMQRPLELQVSPKDWQLLHDCPFVPQAFGLVPPMQVLFWQHPEQFPGPHMVTQRPPMQVSPKLAQLLHAWPPTPQANGVEPA